MEISRILTEEDSRELDNYTINTKNMPAFLLMGLASVSIFQEYKKLLKGRTVYILCGNGNNGGDGLAISYFLHQEKYKILVFIRKGKNSEEYLYYKELLVKSGIETKPISDLKNYLKNEKSNETAIIDSLLGTGFQGEIKDEFKEAIEVINSYRSENKKAIVISVDTPSGFQHGAKNNYIICDYLAEIGTHKLKNSFYLNHQKSIHPIGFPVEEFVVLKNNYNSIFFMHPETTSVLKNEIKREKDSHKYKNGSACFIGGSEGMTGAILSSQLAFHCLGGGISKTFTPSEKTVTEILKADESMMVSGIRGYEKDSFFQKSEVTVIGPGLSEKEEIDTDSILKSKKFCIIDAGGFYFINKKYLHDKAILTPHPGEFSRITGSSETNPEKIISIIRDFCKEHNTNLMYKSHFTILGLSNGEIYIWNEANPKLAVMGTGDLVCGIMAFFLSRKKNIPQSVLLTLSLLKKSLSIKELYPTVSSIRKYMKRKFT